MVMLEVVLDLGELGEALEVDFFHGEVGGAMEMMRIMP
jgi:hypothetical protein